MHAVWVNIQQYTCATIRALRNRLARRSGPWLVVFAYHGVTPQPHIARLSYELHLDRDTFVQHCQVIADHFKTCHIDQFLEYPEGCEDAVYALLTFDDVYDNVVTTALPILEAYRLKCMLFLTTDYVGSSTLFWWDRVRFALLSAPYAEITVGRQTYDLSTLRRREQSCVALEAFLSGVGSQRRDALLDELDTLFRRHVLQIFGKALPAFAPISHQSFARVAEHPLCTIGLHSASHPALPDLTAEELHMELARAQNWHQHWRRQPATAICFPFGATNEQVNTAARDAGFRYGFCLDNHRSARLVATPDCSGPLLLVNRHMLVSSDTRRSIIRAGQGYGGGLFRLFGTPLT